jgi:hypothetical protein
MLYQLQAALGRLLLQDHQLLLLLIHLMGEIKMQVVQRMLQQQQTPCMQVVLEAVSVQVEAVALGRSLGYKLAQQEQVQRLAVLHCWHACVNDKPQLQQQQAGASWVQRSRCSSSRVEVWVLSAQAVAGGEQGAAVQM